ncbi:MAG: carbohydrate binding domain-containing protein [Ruminococcus sp.]|nr:carbohydrate binding domain-containing protein [Ruminococcus sp.]
MKKGMFKKLTALAASAVIAGSSGAVYGISGSFEADAADIITAGFDTGTDGWSARGAAKLAVETSSYYSGTGSLSVTGRTDKWNGAALSLAGTSLSAGSSYSFSAAVLQTSGSAADIKMTLEYGSGFQNSYSEVALVTVESGKWTDISNINYTIPEDAGNATLYFEAPDSLIDFCVDSFTVADAGTPSAIVTGKGVVNGSGSSGPDNPGTFIRGDFSGDGVLSVFDLIIGRRKIVNRFAGDSHPTDIRISDVDGNGEFEIADIILLQKFLLHKETKFPDPITTTTTTTTSTTTTTITTSGGGGNGNLMQQMAGDMVNSSPSGFNQKRGGVDYGKEEVVTYQSKDGNCQKKMTVILPPGYNTNEKYPVLYCLHGIGGDNSSMPGMGVGTMLGNLIADGKAEKMIIVCPSMLTGQGNGFGFDQETMRKYDLIREDIENSIMPYMEEHYSIKTGRENTAITGFSLGGREALYCGITHSQYYGYVGGACAAPGIFPTTDKFMTHEGSLKQTGEFKPSVMPEVILISAAQRDDVVGDYPESYHKALQTNGVEHIWNVIPSGDHGNATVDPHMYNFLRYIFKA